MTIEAGALALRISEVGGDQVLAKLTQIDAKARAVGSATQSVKFNAPSLTGINGQLQQLGMSFTRVAQTANAAAPAIDRATASQQKATTTGGALASTLGSQIAGYYSLNQIVNEAVRIFDAVNAASDRQELSQRKLSATSRLTGVSLETVNQISGEAQTKFAISSGAAADLTQGFIKLASRAGSVAETGALMSAWMDLAKAQGLSLSDVMNGVTTTLVGQDEGLNRLGLMNPSNIWKAWADATGTTVAKMTEQEKWLSIINEVMAQGAKVRGEYQNYLDTVPGKQEAFNSALERAAGHIGAAGGATRAWAYDLGTTLLNAFVAADAWLDRIAAHSSAALKFVFLGQAFPKNAVASSDFSPAVDPALVQAQLKAAAAGNVPTTPTKPTAAQLRAAREARETIEKALGFNLGNIPLSSGIPSTGPVGPLVAPSVGVGAGGKMKGVPSFGLADIVDKELDELRERMKAKQAQMQEIVGSVASAVGNAFGDAFSASFKGGDNFFKAFGKSLLSSLGNILMQLGGQMIAYGAIIAPLAALLSFTPFGGLGLGAGASIAAGVALSALGAAMGAAAGGGKTGGGGGASSARGASKAETNDFAVAFDPDRKLGGRTRSAVAPSARSIDSSPMPEGRPPIVFAPTIIGPDDPRAQRQIATMVESAVLRGIAPTLRRG